MVTTRSAKLKLDALEAAPLLHANEPSQKRSKGERPKQQRSDAVKPQTEQPVLSGSSTKSSETKSSPTKQSSSSVASSSTRRPASKAKKQSDKHESQSVCAPARSAARKKQIDESHVEVKTQAVTHLASAVCTPPRSESVSNEQAPAPVCVTIVPEASEKTSSTGSDCGTLRSNTLITPPTQVFQSLASDDLEEQLEVEEDVFYDPEYKECEEEEFYDSIQNNQVHQEENIIPDLGNEKQAFRNVPATRLIAFSLLGALVVLACACGWWFGRFNIASAQATRNVTSTLPLQATRNVTSTLPLQATRNVTSTLPLQATRNVISTLPEQATQYVSSALPTQTTQHVTSTSPSNSNSQFGNVFWMFMVNTLRFARFYTVNVNPYVWYVCTSTMKVWWSCSKAMSDMGLSARNVISYTW
jgi:hypothetical protein